LAPLPPGALSPEENLIMIASGADRRTSGNNALPALAELYTEEPFPAGKPAKNKSETARFQVQPRGCGVIFWAEGSGCISPEPRTVNHRTHVKDSRYADKVN
jgi:hypothetical protein